MNLNVKDGYGCTALHRAAEHGNSKIGRKLLNYNKWLSCTDNVKIANLLIKNGADLNITDNYNDTALRWATVHGNFQFNA